MAIGGFLEVCVDSPAGARAAIAGGADRIELCGALSLGGLTPSAGLARAVMALARPAKVAVRAMVRPRAGDFAYDADDIALAIGEARALLTDGVDGLVFGAMREGHVDMDAIGRWRDSVAPRPGTLTFHRAIDVAADPVTAVEQVIAAGFDEILTSGGAVTAPAGAATIAAMVRQATGRCRIMAGSGVTAGNIATLVATTGVTAVHASARAPSTASVMDNPFGFGRASPPADADVTKALRRAIDNAIV